MVAPIEKGMHRDRKLLDVCHRMPCMLQVAGVCRSGVNPSVPCHSNRQRDGRGKNFKSHDCHAVAGCIECHRWLDEGPAPRAEKDEALTAAQDRHRLYIWKNGLVRVA